MSSWQNNLLADDDAIRAVIRRTRRIAVLGIKPESRAHKPAYFVPAYLHAAGYDIVPVPVYYPDLEEIFGRPVYRRLADIPGPVDMVDVFRRAEHIEPHVPDILAKRPAAVWLQSGIRHDGATAELAREGILVVQSRCLMVDHQRLVAPQRQG